MKTETIKPINLKTIGLVLLANNSITANVSDQGKVITASDLKNQLPNLKPLGETPLIKIFPTATGMSYLIPTLYRQDGEVVLVLPDINASTTDDFTVSSWEAGDVNRAVVTSKSNDISLSIGIAFTNLFLDMIRSEHNNHYKSDSVEKLNTQWLKDAPALEHPLRKLPQNEVLTILNVQEKRSDKYNTQLVNIKTSNGKVYNNVITNATLREFIADNIKQFKITDVIPVNVKDRNSSKRETRTIHKVFLEPAMSTDFSSL